MLKREAKQWLQTYNNMDRTNHLVRWWKQASVLSALAARQLSMAWLVARRVGGRVRVAAWKARWPQPLPPNPLFLFVGGGGR
jgi:hypothetical protein